MPCSRGRSRPGGSPLLVVIGIWKHVVRHASRAAALRPEAVVDSLSAGHVHGRDHVVVWIAILVWCFLIAGLATRFINWIALVKAQGAWRF